MRDTAAMLGNRAVYQDLTRRFLRGRGYTGPDITPRESAEHLLAIAAEHDFTLFEYFPNGHDGAQRDSRGRPPRPVPTDEFLSVLLAWPARPGRLLALTSDHGNVEDSRTKRHTTNPVPLAAVGEGSGLLKEKVKSLADFVPAILEIYPHWKLES